MKKEFNALYIQSLYEPWMAGAEAYVGNNPAELRDKVLCGEEPVTIIGGNDSTFCFQTEHGFFAYAYIEDSEDMEA